MNFVAAYQHGQKGKNQGLTTGIRDLDRAVDGVQRRSIYGLAASPKVGKTMLADLSFVIEPYLDFLEQKKTNPSLELDIIYFSFEINRVRKEFKYAAHFMYRDYGVSYFEHKGVKYPMSPRYLEGKLKDDDDQMILVSPEHEKYLKEIYERRIIPLFGKYGADGRKVQDGIIHFIEEKDNPTGLRNQIMHYAKQRGTFILEKYRTVNEQGVLVNKERIVGYKSNNEDRYTIIITDHLRKLRRERGFSMKENVDKFLEYSVEFRNWCNFTFVHIVHLNRDIADMNRIKYLSEFLYPTGDDVKDTGNLSEDCDYLLTLFNAHDEKYGIKRHFGIDITQFPNYRSIHLVESRDTECPQHLQLQMVGGINLFKPLITNYEV